MSSPDRFPQTRLQNAQRAWCAPPVEHQQGDDLCICLVDNQERQAVGVVGFDHAISNVAHLSCQFVATEIGAVRPALIEGWNYRRLSKRRGFTNRGRALRRSVRWLTAAANESRDARCPQSCATEEHEVFEPHSPTITSFSAIRRTANALWPRLNISTACITFVPEREVRQRLGLGARCETGSSASRRFPQPIGVQRPASPPGARRA